MGYHKPQLAKPKAACLDGKSPHRRWLSSGCGSYFLWPAAHTAVRS
jgi:hypothetical protein